MKAKIIVKCARCSKEKMGELDVRGTQTAGDLAIAAGMKSVSIRLPEYNGNASVNGLKALKGSHDARAILCEECQAKVKEFMDKATDFYVRGFWRSASIRQIAEEVAS